MSVLVNGNNKFYSGLGDSCRVIRLFQMKLLAINILPVICEAQAHADDKDYYESCQSEVHGSGVPSAMLVFKTAFWLSQRWLTSEPSNVFIFKPRKFLQLKKKANLIWWSDDHFKDKLYELSFLCVGDIHSNIGKCK